MLIGIPRLISPQLMRLMMEMGHGDELAIADANFPAHAIARSCSSGEVVHSEGCGAAELLDAVLRLLPLDYAVPTPITCMAPPEGAEAPEIHGRFAQVLAARGCSSDALGFLPRFEFYDRAKTAYAVVITGESARFANLIIKKGVV